jgi:hypothetical protein
MDPLRDSLFLLCCLRFLLFKSEREARAGGPETERLGKHRRADPLEPLRRVLVNPVVARLPDPASVFTGSPKFRLYVLPSGYLLTAYCPLLIPDRTRRATPDSSPRIGRPPVAALRLRAGRVVSSPLAETVGWWTEPWRKEVLTVLPVSAHSRSEKRETGSDPAKPAGQAGNRG